MSSDSRSRGGEQSTRRREDWSLVCFALCHDRDQRSTATPRADSGNDRRRKTVGQPLRLPRHSPLPRGERIKVTGSGFWFSQIVVRRVIWFEWIESLESKPSTAVFSAKTSRT